MRAPVLALSAAALLLSACAIEVNGETDSSAGYYKVRSPTDLCRREVERSFGDRHRIAYELPELTTNGANQTVVQAFTLAAKKENFEAPERRSIRCAFNNGALTEVSGSPPR